MSLFTFGVLIYFSALCGVLGVSVTRKSRNSFCDEWEDLFALRFLEYGYPMFGGWMIPQGVFMNNLESLHESKPLKGNVFYNTL